MSTMLTAATDPIFYAHHANIDRFWSSWIGTNPEFPREEPNRVFFFDEVEWKWQFIWFADLIDETKLGYSYASKISTTPAHA